MKNKRERRLLDIGSWNANDWVVFFICLVLFVAIRWAAESIYADIVSQKTDYPPVSAVVRPSVNTDPVPFVVPPHPAEPEQGPALGATSTYGNWTLITDHESAVVTTFPTNVLSTILGVYRFVNEGCQHFRMILMTRGNTANAGMVSVKVDGNLMAFVPIHGNFDPSDNTTAHIFQFGFNSPQINKDMLNAMANGNKMSIIYLGNDQSNSEYTFDLHGSYKALFGQQKHCLSLEQTQPLPAPGNGPTL